MPPTAVADVASESAAGNAYAVHERPFLNRGTAQRASYKMLGLPQENELPPILSRGRRSPNAKGRNGCTALSAWSGRVPFQLQRPLEEPRPSRTGSGESGEIQLSKASGDCKGESVPCKVVVASMLCVSVFPAHIPEEKFKMRLKLCRSCFSLGEDL